MAAIIVYGIANCDTIKKTLAFFKEQKMDVDFWDYKKLGIGKQKILDWCKIVGWQVLLNKKSTTWRGLSLAQQEKIINQAAAIKLMQENTSIIKRPVIDFGGKLIVGFNETEIIKQLK